MIELLRLLLAAHIDALRSRQRLLLENLLLRQQFQVALRNQRRPRLRTRDKLFWLLVHHLHRNWRRHLLLVRPEAVLRWHRQAWRLPWRWRSGRSLGRPRLKPEVRVLIATMAHKNPHWGTERIRGELLKLGIAVSARSIRRHRRRGPSRPPSQSWRTFLANHAQAIWAADLFVVQTLTFQTLYLLFLISHDRRRLLHFNVTAHPTAAWVYLQAARRHHRAAGVQLGHPDHHLALNDRPRTVDRRARAGRAAVLGGDLYVGERGTPAGIGAGQTAGAHTQEDDDLMVTCWPMPVRSASPSSQILNRL